MVFIQIGLLHVKMLTVISMTIIKKIFEIIILKTATKLNGPLQKHHKGKSQRRQRETKKKQDMKKPSNNMTNSTLSAFILNISRLNILAIYRDLENRFEN